MELKKRIDLKYILLGVYLLAFTIYIINGLQPAQASVYDVSGSLNIPSIGLVTDVTTLHLVDHELNTPDDIAGSFSRAENKTLLIGHSSTVFSELHNIKLGDQIDYNGVKYVVKSSEVFEKSAINMGSLLKKADIDTIVIMTCAGENLPNSDATHRLIVVAEVV